MAIRTRRALAPRHRQNAADCEQAASNVLLDARARLLKTAEHCGMLADKVESPRRDQVGVTDERLADHSQGVEILDGFAEPSEGCIENPASDRRRT